ncbi:MAG: hypothetical protein ABIQ03_13240, partial [Burkholderiales bacterium]
MFKKGQSALLGGAGSVSNKVLSLGADGNTTLTVTDASFNITATSKDFRVTSRNNGSVMMLCNQAAP